MRIALGLEYDGSCYYGWQSQPQPGLRTIQECVEKALSTIANHKIRTIAAGRTDAGVHALGQVLHFDTNAERSTHSWVFGSNTYLPRDISVLWAHPVSTHFHARFSALTRHYQYVILNRKVRPAIGHSRVSWYYRPLDENRMAQAAKYLVGEHDFSAYRAVSCQAKSPIRTIYRLEVARYGQHVVMDIVANAFLHHMVRNIAGVLTAIGTGDHEPYWAHEVLEGRDRTLGGITAPPQGLTLVHVQYCEAFGLPNSPPYPQFDHLHILP